MSMFHFWTGESVYKYELKNSEMLRISIFQKQDICLGKFLFEKIIIN